MSLKVKLQQNVFDLWIISPVENPRLAWSGTQWTPIDRDGVSVGDEKILSFATATEAAAYALKSGFEIQHG